MKVTEYSILHDIITQLNVEQQETVLKELDRRLALAKSLDNPNGTPIVVSREVYNNLRECKENNAKLAAVKELKNAAEIGLREAKDVIDFIWARI